MRPRVSTTSRLVDQPSRCPEPQQAPQCAAQRPRCPRCDPMPAQAMHGRVGRAAACPTSAARAVTIRPMIVVIHWSDVAHERAGHRADGRPAVLLARERAAAAQHHCGALRSGARRRAEGAHHCRSRSAPTRSACYAARRPAVDTVTGGAVRDAAHGRHAVQQNVPAEVSATWTVMPVVAAPHASQRRPGPPQRKVLWCEWGWGSGRFMPPVSRSDQDGRS